MARVILSVFVEMLCITSPTYFPHYVVPHHVFPHYVVPHHVVPHHVSRSSPCDVFPPTVVPHHVVRHHVFPPPRIPPPRIPIFTLRPRRRLRPTSCCTIRPASGALPTPTVLLLLFIWHAP